MAPTYRTPGVYIQEVDRSPVTVVDVPTGVPVFIGYTETATESGRDLTGTPAQVTNLSGFYQRFGGRPSLGFTFDAATGAHLTAATRFNLARAVEQFYTNGGGPCFVLSVGPYGPPGTPTPKSPDDFGDAVWQALADEATPSLIVIPDAVLMPDPAGYQAIWARALAFCAEQGARFAILDVLNGDRARDMNPDTDVISGQQGLRGLIDGAGLGLAAAYYPWVKATGYDGGHFNFLDIAEGDRAALVDALEIVLPPQPDTEDGTDGGGSTHITDATPPLTGLDPQVAHALHLELRATNAGYTALLDAMAAQANVMPPSGMIAGVYAATDQNLGVWKAPAGVALSGVSAPCVDITDTQNEDLNAPIDGKSVNAIRDLPGRGVTVWGARTMDALNPEARYVNLRRTLIMIDQSILQALHAFVFEPNTPQTWATIIETLRGFLTQLWQQGAMPGVTPEQSFQVNVGLGRTMTQADIDQGQLVVQVGVALVKPAEFTILVFRQPQQTA